MSSHRAKIHRKETAREVAMAMVSDIKNILKAAFLDRIGKPSSGPSLLLKPPGIVKAAAKVTVEMRMAVIVVFWTYLLVNDSIRAFASSEILSLAFCHAEVPRSPGMAPTNSEYTSFCMALQYIIQSVIIRRN